MKKPKQKVILFIHRSVGQHLIDDGQLEPRIEKAAAAVGIKALFLDINNNYTPIPGQDSTPDEYADYFAKHAQPEYLVIIKSCYPNNAIKTDYALEHLKLAYRDIVDNFLAKSKGKLLIMTTPPLRSTRTNQAEAKRARALADWLIKEPFDKRIMVFNFFDLLAEKNGKNSGMLKKQYQTLWPWDSHPNKKANLDIAPKLTEVIVEVIK